MYQNLKNQSTWNAYISHIQVALALFSCGLKLLAYFQCLLFEKLKVRCLDEQPCLEIELFTRYYNELGGDHFRNQFSLALSIRHCSLDPFYIKNALYWIFTSFFLSNWKSIHQTFGQFVVQEYGVELSVTTMQYLENCCCE